VEESSKEILGEDDSEEPLEEEDDCEESLDDALRELLQFSPDIFRHSVYYFILL